MMMAAMLSQQQPPSPPSGGNQNAATASSESDNSSNGGSASSNGENSVFTFPPTNGFFANGMDLQQAQQLQVGFVFSPKNFEEVPGGL
jgi:hypothetical protein